MPQPTTVGGEPDLRHYVAVLLRRKWIVIGVAAATVAMSLLYSFSQDKVFEARAEVIIRGGASQVVLNPNKTLTPVEQDVDTELRIMRGSAMAEAITEEMGYFPEIETDTSEKTPRISILGQDSSPERAAKEATDFATGFVTERRRQIDQELRTAIDDVASEKPALDLQAAEAERRITEIDFIVAAGGAAPDEAAQLRFERNRLRGSITTGAIARQQAIQSALDQLQIALANNSSRGSFTVANAVVPESPISPKPLLNAVIALLTGLLLGVAAAFAVDFFDDTMRTKEDLDNATGGRTVLSLIPAVPGWRDRETPVLESVTHPHSATSEAYRSLRTSLEFAAIEHKIGIIHITSSTSGEGKTTTAANLAVTLANAGKRVVLVDCDLRRPRVHQFFGMENSVGFTSVLKGEVDVQDALRPAPEVDGLMVLASGPTPPNPAELLSTKAAQNLLEALAKFVDTVVVDSPPLLPVADSSVLAGYAHATILVVTARSTTRRSLHRSLEMLAQVNAPLEGILFNGVGPEASYTSGYGYGYYDEGDEPSGRKLIRSLSKRSDP